MSAKRALLYGHTRVFALSAAGIAAISTTIVAIDIVVHGITTVIAFPNLFAGNGYDMRHMSQ